MIKENQILNLVSKNGGIVTTREITENNIPRIYITKLVKDNKLYRIDRGIYSTTKREVNNYYSMQVKSKKIIFSHFTALEIQKFYKNIDKKTHISVMQSYNAKKFSDCMVFYNNKTNYKLGLKDYDYNGHKIRIYDVERSVCDIIKDRNRFNELEYNKFINYYFNLNQLNYKKLLEYSTSLRISKLVHHYLALFKA